MTATRTHRDDEATRYGRAIGIIGPGYAERAIEAEIAAQDDEQATAEIVARYAEQEAA